MDSGTVSRHPSGGSSRTSGREGGCWPTASQEVLLRAALRPGVEAVDAWWQWCATSDLDRLDHFSTQLLPQVYRNLQDAQAHAVPEIGRLRGIYRRSWYRNQLVLHAAAGVREQLAAAGIPTMLVAGAAVALRHDPSLAARPIDDAGALVAASDMRRAQGVAPLKGSRPPSPAR